MHVQYFTYFVYPKSTSEVQNVCGAGHSPSQVDLPGYWLIIYFSLYLIYNSYPCLLLWLEISDMGQDATLGHVSLMQLC